MAAEPSVNSVYIALGCGVYRMRVENVLPVFVKDFDNLFRFSNVLIVFY